MSSGEALIEVLRCLVRADSNLMERERLLEQYITTRQREAKTLTDQIRKEFDRMALVPNEPKRPEAA